MANSDSETIPLLQLYSSEKNEEDLDISRETETTDDECEEEHVSRLEQSDHSSNDDRSQSSNSTSNSQIGKGREALSYFAGDVLTSSEDSNMVSSATSSVRLGSQLGKGREALSYFAGNVLTSSEDSNKVSSATSSVDLGCVIEYTTDEHGNVDYVDVDFDETISEKHIAKLMNKLRLNHYTAISCEGDFTISKCKGLFERDYYCEVAENPGGNLSPNYPARLIIPVARKSKTASSERLDAADFNPNWYHQKIRKSVYSRLLTRFVAPVILFDKKFICRSGSLTVRKTAVFETARQKEVPKSLHIAASVVQQIARKLASSIADFSSRSRKAASQLFFPNSMGELRDVDAEIMRELKIQRICDLMVEDRKKFKQTIRISSSEKINKDIYKDCEIEQMPYPGCSFFRRYHEANLYPGGLVFDWERRDVNTVMKFSVDPYEIFPDVNWTDYKEWDLVDLTKNYLKMMLTYLVKDTGGMLVHCISGWDRTPLFISLLRVSLWADGVIHESLDYTDMAYLTLAYDWYLFGHNLPRRLTKKQEIMHFCFNFLRYIADDEFSVTRMFHELPDDEKRGRIFPEYSPERRPVLLALRSYVLDIYAEYITSKMD